MVSACCFTQPREIPCCSHLPACAELQVGVCTLLLVLLLSVAVTAGRFAANLGRRKATTDTVLDFGFQVGGLCAVAGLLNMAQIGLVLASGLLSPPQLGGSVKSHTKPYALLFL
jgi:hypothetical protein